MLTQKEVREVFYYDLISANLVWKTDRGNQVKAGNPQDNAMSGILEIGLQIILE